MFYEIADLKMFLKIHREAAAVESCEFVFSCGFCKIFRKILLKNLLQIVDMTYSVIINPFWTSFSIVIDQGRNASHPP